LGWRCILCCEIVFTTKAILHKESATKSKYNVIPLENPAENTDLLSDLLRAGAGELIAKAVQTELAEFLSQYQDMTDNH
jgi:hypothetical protein